MNIIFIMGRPHCGSTILGNLLGDADTVFAGGELHTVAYDSRQLCSCGKYLDHCDLWRRVKSQYDADSTGPRWADLVSEVRRFRNPRNYFRLLMSESHQRLYVRAYKKLYELIADVTGAEHVVDTGRNPVHALVLLRHFSNSKVVFLIRSGDAAVHSKLKRLQNGEGFKLFDRNWEDPSFYMPLFLLLGLNWSVGNIMSELICRKHRVDCLRIRYEDLCADISEQGKLLSTFLNVNLDPVLYKIKQNAEIPILHNIGGNILRFQQRFVFQTMRQPSLPFKCRTSFRLFAWPVMVYYRYSGRIR